MWNGASTYQGPNFGAHFLQLHRRHRPFVFCAPFPPIEAFDLICQNRARTRTGNHHLERIILDLRGHGATNHHAPQADGGSWNATRSRATGFDAVLTRQDWLSKLVETLGWPDAQGTVRTNAHKQSWHPLLSNHRTSWIWKIAPQGTARFIGWRPRSVPALRQVLEAYKIVFTLRFLTLYSVDPPEMCGLERTNCDV